MNQVCNKEMNESKAYLTCPFCDNRCIEPRYGETTCPVCDAAFEIDDRLECVFGDTDNIRLPATGTICASCGLIQTGDNQNCLYCGIEINSTLQ